jgi:hypothetical protein
MQRALRRQRETEDPAILGGSSSLQDAWRPTLTVQLKLRQNKLRQLPAKSTAPDLLVFLVPFQRARCHRVDVGKNLVDHLR